MSTDFYAKKKKASKLRKMPFLPRIGLYVDVAGYEVVFKYAPFLEAIASLVGQPMGLSQLKKISKEQLAEIKFPKISPGKIFDTTAQTITVRSFKKR